MGPAIAIRPVRFLAGPFARTLWCPRTQPHLRKLPDEPKASCHATHDQLLDGVDLRSARRTQAFNFGLFCHFRLLSTLRGAPTRDGIVGARTQVDKNIVDITHDIRIGAKCGHHFLSRRVNVFNPARYCPDEIAIADRFEYVLEPGRIGRAFSVRPVADVAIRMITAETGVGVPVHGAITVNFESRGVVLVKILAVILSHHLRIARAVCDRGNDADAKRHRDEYRKRKTKWFHGVSSVISHHRRFAAFYNRTRGAAKRRRPGSTVPTLRAGRL